MEDILKLLNIHPPKFHSGDAVVCIDPSIPHDNSPGITYHLDMTTVYQVAAVKRRYSKWYLLLVGNSEFVFEEIHFAPAELLPDAAVAELLAESLEGVPA